MKTTNIKLSICGCGFSVLRCEIPLGTEYDIDLVNAIDGVFVCGGCKKVHRIQLVPVKPFGCLPIGIFDLSPQAIAIAV